MTIWGKLKGREIEKIDTCTKADAAYLVGEYRMAFSKDWVIWAGLKRDYMDSLENERDQRQNRY